MSSVQTKVFTLTIDSKSWAVEGYGGSHIHLISWGDVHNLAKLKMRGGGSMLIPDSLATFSIVNKINCLMICRVQDHVVKFKVVCLKTETDFLAFFEVGTNGSYRFNSSKSNVEFDECSVNTTEAFRQAGNELTSYKKTSNALFGFAKIQTKLYDVIDAAEVADLDEQRPRFIRISGNQPPKKRMGLSSSSSSSYDADDAETMALIGAMDTPDDVFAVFAAAMAREERQERILARRVAKTMSQNLRQRRAMRLDDMILDSLTADATTRAVPRILDTLDDFMLDVDLSPMHVTVLVEDEEEEEEDEEDFIWFTG